MTKIRFGWKLLSLLLSLYGINTSREAPDRFIKIFLNFESYDVVRIKAKSKE